MSINCSDTGCPIILNSQCVIYEGETLSFTRINTNDDIQTVIQKLNDAIASGGESGSVTSVGGLSPLFTVANPTTTPTFTAINQAANLVYAGPATGAAAAPTFRSLVAADLPNDSEAYWKTVGTSILTGATDIDIQAQTLTINSSTADGTVFISSGNSIERSYLILTDDIQLKTNASAILSSVQGFNIESTNGALNLVGITITANINGDVGSLSKILGSDGAGNVVWVTPATVGHVIENSGTPLTARANLNFTNGLTASDNTPDIDVKLGGAITSATNINLDDFIDFIVTTGGFNVTNTGTHGLSVGNGSMNFNATGVGGIAQLVFQGDGTGDVTFADGRTTKKGIEYSVAGYVTTDRSLTDRGYVLGAKTYIGTQTFLSSGLELNNPANTFHYTIVGSAIIADRTVTLPLLTGNDLFVMEAFATTLTNKTLGIGTVFSVVPTINDGIKFTFNPSSTVSGLNFGAHTTDPSVPVNGDFYYDSTNNIFRGYQGSSWNTPVTIDDVGDVVLGSWLTAIATRQIIIPNNKDFTLACTGTGNMQIECAGTGTLTIDIGTTIDIVSGDLIQFIAPDGIVIFTSSSPPGAGTTDATMFYARDIVAGNSAAHFMTENGQEIRLYTTNAGSAYSITNGSIDRTYDANATTIDEIADVLYTLIEDLKLSRLIA